MTVVVPSLAASAGTPASFEASEAIGGHPRSATPLLRRVSSAKKAIFLSSQAPTASRLPLPQLRRSLVRAPMAGSTGSSRTDAITGGDGSDVEPSPAFKSLTSLMGAQFLKPIASFGSGIQMVAIISDGRQEAAQRLAAS